MSNRDCNRITSMSTESLFVEDSFALSTKGVLDNLDNVLEIGPSVYVKPHADVDYWLEDPLRPSVLLVSVGGQEPQRINLEWIVITFGQRAYFRCDCGSRAAKLYLPLKGKEFKCRQCHKLQYQLTRINRRSVAGRAMYRMNRLQKLSDTRVSMGRILYNGKYSERFERFLRLCDRAGFDGIVKGANELKALIQG